MSLLLVNANTLHIPLADGSVHMALTSPPYWGLRSYAGTATWEGGDAECDHVETIRPQRDHDGPYAFGQTRGNEPAKTVTKFQYRDICGKCGAIRIDAQLGLEKLHDCGAWTRNTGKVIGFKEVEDWDEDETPDGERVFDFKGYKVVPIYESAQGCGECFICHCREWAREVWRVLRDDGTFWLNIGDSYAGSPAGNFGSGTKPGDGGAFRAPKPFDSSKDTGLKQKDMCLIPQRLALALQQDGWYVRSEIIWMKPNPMPESVTDRPTKSHETVWLLAKNQRYYYDADAVREGYLPQSFERNQYLKGKSTSPGRHKPGNQDERYKELHIQPLNPAGRNRRDVWQIATAPYSGAHFATWPPGLVEPMIKAGTSERGCCPNCGKQWERVTEKGELVADDGGEIKDLVNPIKRDDSLVAWSRPGGKVETVRPNHHRETTTLGFRPSCSCPPHEPVPCTVLDPFAGSGTSLLVARQLGRNAIGLDLSYPYLHDQARSRLSLDALDAWVNGKKDGKVITDLPLFATLD